ncbi:MAG: sec-independent protein translocase protein TatB [bacterium]|nr:MAG: sec-independent protein translocase protein TatB [bacterium]
MGNLGWTEMIFIAMIALMVFGPKRLPEMGKKLGRLMGQLRQASDQFKQVWDSEVEKTNLKEMQQKVQQDLSPSNLLNNNTSTKTINQPDSLASEESNALGEAANQISFTNSTDIPTSDSEIITTAEPIQLNSELLNPPIGATIERAKPSFDLMPASTAEVIAQVEETQPISLSKN